MSKNKISPEHEESIKYRVSSALEEAVKLLENDPSLLASVLASRAATDPQSVSIEAANIGRRRYFLELYQSVEVGRSARFWTGSNYDSGTVVLIVVDKGVVIKHSCGHLFAEFSDVVPNMSDEEVLLLGLGGQT